MKKRPNTFRRGFYDRLAAAVAPAMPTRLSYKNGIGWRSGLPGVYHHVIVLPYIGEFSRTGAHERPIPRIHLNHFDFWPGVSKAQCRRWAEGSWTPFMRSDAMLELTTTLEELPDFTEWITAWAKAHDQDDCSLLGPAPYPIVEIGWGQDPFEVSYLWTTAASKEYEAYRKDIR